VLPDALVELALENGRPVWTFERDGLVFEKRIVFTHRQNTVRVAYRLAAAERPARLVLTPALSLRAHEGRVDLAPAPFRVERNGDGVEEGVEVLSDDDRLPPLRLLAKGAGAPLAGATTTS
jgi:hypothetical protein